MDNTSNHCRRSTVASSFLDAIVDLRRSRLSRYAWLPIPFFLLLTLALWVLDHRAVYPSPLLEAGLFFVFSALVSSVVACLIAQSVAARGSLGLLFLGCGVLFFGAAGVAGWIAVALKVKGSPLPNAQVTIHNTCAWMAAALHLSGAAFSVRGASIRHGRRVWIAFAYGSSLAAVVLVVLAAASGWLPVFMVQGQGGTPVRQAVMGSAIVMVLLTTVLLRRMDRREKSAFIYWYTCSLLLLAIAFGALMAATGRDTALSWLGRAGQYSGGLYMFLAALAALRQAQAEPISLGRASSKAFHPYVLAIAVVIAAAVVRYAFLEQLGPQYRLLPFYPAVAFAGLYGGLRPGLLATALSLVAVLSLWGGPGGGLPPLQAVDILGLEAFFVVGWLISWISERLLAAQAEAARQRDELVSLVNATPSLIWTATPDGLVEYCSGQTLTYMAADQSELLGDAWLQTVHPDDQAPMWAAWQAAVRTGAPYDVESRMRIADGSYRWLRLRAVPKRDEDGNVVKWYGSALEIHDLREAQRELELHGERLEAQVAVRTAELRASEERYRALFEHMTEGFATGELIHNEHGQPVDFRLLEVNGACERECGLARALVGQAVLQSLPEMNPILLPLYSKVVSHGDPVRFQFRNESSEQYFEVSAYRPEPGRFAILFRNITEQKLAEKRLEHLAHHDALTGLPNRALAVARLNDALLRARRTEKPLAVLYIDLDQFKPVNDSMGHAAGDILLQAVAARLLGCVRKTDTVARLGGDEFLIVLDELGEADEAGWLAQNALTALARPFQVLDRPVYVSASLGIACFPQDGRTAETLMRHADTAMYKAKEEGKNRYQFFSAGMNKEARERAFFTTSLRHAVARGELALVYQPRIATATGELLGVEALVRWHSPEHGLILPGRFIGFAEETGIIEPLGEWVLQTACAQMQEWRRLGACPGFVSVNISRRQFSQPHLANMVGQVLADTGLEPVCLELEITENSAMINPEKGKKTLAQLEALGVRLSLDDFGTGHSSLAHLQRFPVHHLKIDQSFVRELPGSSDSAAITRAIIAMAKSLGLGVTAEGIETEAQRRFLLEAGCDAWQGYLFTEPVGPTEIPLWMARAASVSMPQNDA